MTSLFSTPKTPKAPDPVATANAQSAANKEAVIESAKVNQINQVTPYGELRYSGDIGSPNRTVTQTLSPSQQQQLDQQNQIAGGLGSAAINQMKYLPQDRFSLSGLPEYQKAGSPDDFLAQRQQVQDATYKSLTAPMEQRFQRQNTEADQRLANRGIVEGSGLYNNLQGDIRRSQNEAYDQAAQQALLAGSDEAARLYGQNLQGANQANSVRSQMAQDLLTERNQPFNELSSFLQGAPSMQQPNYANTGQYNVGAAPIADSINSAYQNRLAAYGTQIGGQNAALGALGTIGGMALGGAGLFGGTAAAPVATQMTFLPSDVRLKEHIIPSGIDNGHKMYEFNYIGNPQRYRGVMAQDILETHPEAVIEGDDGFYKVDYAKLGVDMTEVE